jgi:hypothetical protein
MQASNPQDAGMLVLSRGNGILICLRSPDPTKPLHQPFFMMDFFFFEIGSHDVVRRLRQRDGAPKH